MPPRSAGTHVDAMVRIVPPAAGRTQPRAEAQGDTKTAGAAGRPGSETHRRSGPGTGIPTLSRRHGRTRQLVARIIDRARAGRLPVIGSGAALIDTTYVDNAAGALVAAVDVCGPVHGEPLVVSNGEPRPVAEVISRLCRSAGVPGPRGHVPFPIAWTAGAAVEALWARTRRRSTPPLTRFLAEQLATAHWFDQRRTITAWRWRPEVSRDEGFSRLAAWCGSSVPAAG